MAEFIHTNYGKIDVIVNNAGISQQKLFTDITENDWDRMFDVNMKVCISLQRLLLMI